MGAARRDIDRAIEDELAGVTTETIARKTFADLATWYEEKYLKPPELRGELEIDGLRSWKKLKTPLKVLKEEFGNEALVTIDWSRIEDFRQRYQRTPTRHGKARMVHSPNRALELLRRMLNLAKRKPLKWIRENPFDDEEPLIHKGEEVERMVILSRLQEEMIIEACKGPRAHLRAAIIYAIDTAARPNEQFSTTKEHVKLDDGLTSSHVAGPR